jgi:two-component system, chemotaxis family, chemotaxis protein CheY
MAMTATAAEADLSFAAKKNRETPQAAPGGGSGKDPGLARICGLFYLIVDDNRFSRTAAKSVLHGIGIRRIVECETAEQAQNLLKNTAIDVIIVDFEMPGMSGAEFTWRLRRAKDENVQRTPVIMVSDHADENHIRLAIDAGVNEFVPKPFSQKDIYSRLQRSIISPRPFIVAPGYIGPDRHAADGGLGGERMRPGSPTLPALLLDFTGPEPKRIEIAKPGMGALKPAEPAAAPAKPAAIPEEKPAASPQPQPSFSVLSETKPSEPAAAGGLAATLKERIDDKRPPG